MSSLERPDLAPYAAKSHLSRGRKYSEDFKDDRPAFERDRDRIIHSSAFRRLEYKTQVFVNHEGDYYRTRLTHSLEVAQIAKGIARQLNLNEDLTESLALAHDLGHTPFGHSGEKALNQLMQDKGGFEHNRQSLRVVEYLEDKYPGFRGLNLSWETREGIIKHTSHCDHPDYDNLDDYCPEQFRHLRHRSLILLMKLLIIIMILMMPWKPDIISLDDLRSIKLCEEIIRGGREKVS